MGHGAMRYEIEVDITPNGDEDYSDIKVVVFEVDEGDQHRQEVGTYTAIGYRTDWPHRDIIAELIGGAL